MKIIENISLATFTTFKIGGPARFFAVAKTKEDIVEAIDFAEKKHIPYIVIGGGSNILFFDEGYFGLVIKNEIKGVEFVENKDDTVTVTAHAGENWSEFVEKTVYLGYYGLENLSSIPGTVGASPIQNIGAYGTEVSEFIKEVYVYDTDKKKFLTLTKKQCKFSYRHSLFKDNKSRYVVISVTFILRLNHEVNICYKDLAMYFDGKSRPSLVEVHRAVIEIRQNKLPDWKSIGTAGSFFKNPIISKRKYNELKKKYPDIPGFMEDGKMKVSLGWIIDKVLKWKGKKHGKAGVYDKQALVIIAEQGATAQEVKTLAEKIMQEVREKTGIHIEAEVEWAIS